MFSLVLVSLIFWCIAIFATYYGLSNGLVVEANPFYDSLFQNKGLLYGLAYFALVNFAPVFVCLSFGITSRSIGRKVGNFWGSDAEERHELAIIVETAISSICLLMLLFFAFLAIPNGWHDLITVFF